MVGFGFADELPQEYQTQQEAVRIFVGNPMGDDTAGGGFGQWMALQPGLGTQYRASADSVFLSPRFGPEVSFGKHLASLTGDHIAIIKYAKGGSSIALGASDKGTWEKEYHENTTINQWDHFLQTLKNALSQGDIDGDGRKDSLVPAGIVWMQGEADAYHPEASQVYLENLATLMGQITEALGGNSLPIVLGRIEDSGNTPETRSISFPDNQHGFRPRHCQMSCLCGGPAKAGPISRATRGLILRSGLPRTTQVESTANLLSRRTYVTDYMGFLPTTQACFKFAVQP